MWRKGSFREHSGLNFPNVCALETQIPSWTKQKGASEKKQAVRWEDLMEAACGDVTPSPKSL